MSDSKPEPLAEVAAGWSRPLGSDPRDPVPGGKRVEHGRVVERAPEYAEADVLIERPDLAPGSHTLVNAGDVIPAGLADLPRKPAAPARKPKS